MATTSNPRVGYEYDIKSGSTIIRGMKMVGLFNMSAGMQVTVHLFFVL